jgi:hypothetical protein
MTDWAHASGALLLAWTADRLFGEPRSAWHPVAWFGHLAAGATAAAGNIGVDDIRARCGVRVRPNVCVEPALPRGQELAVRDAASFGLPGWWRVSAQAPAAQDAFMHALDLAERRRG